MRRTPTAVLAILLARTCCDVDDGGQLVSMTLEPIDQDGYA